MAIRLCILLSCVMLPLIFLFLPGTAPRSLVENCHIRTLTVREGIDQTVVTLGQWWLKPEGKKGYGLFYGRVQFMSPTGELKREILIDRNLTISTHIVGGLLETETTSVSKISGDNISDQDLERYVSPIFITGHKNYTSIFKTPGGNFLTGLNGRPMVKCDDTTMPFNKIKQN